MRFRVVSLGCKANRYDARRLAAALASSGWQEVDGTDAADVALIFGCVVTKTAEAKSRHALHRAGQNSARTIIVGCTGRMWEKDGGSLVLSPERTADKLLPLLGLSCAEVTGAFLAEGRTRAVVKVQEGCPAACSYCIVPQVRPGSSSRSPEDVLAEVQAAADSGIPEIVITGVHTGLYGHDLHDKTGLAALLQFLLQNLRKWPGRLRLSSVEPLEVTDALVETIVSSNGRIAPFIHLPLQSGDDAVLKRMNRPYRAAEYMAVVEKLKRAPLGIGMDVLVGFPGETDSAFAGTLRIINEVRPVRVHVFSYSERPGTPAAEFSGTVPPKVRKERARIADETARSATRAFAESLAGKTVDVIPEGKELRSGYTGEYASFFSAKPFRGKGIRKALVKAVCESGPFPAATVDVEELP